MYRTDVYFGCFCSPYRGHHCQMIVASTKYEKLIVVISDNKKQTEQICRVATERATVYAAADDYYPIVAEFTWNQRFRIYSTSYDIYGNMWYQIDVDGLYG